MDQMLSRFRNLTIAAILGAGLLFAVMPIAGQQQAAVYRAPRTADGKPNLNAIWQARNEASWDTEGHAARLGRVTARGAEDATPPGLGIVEGGAIRCYPAVLA